MTDLYETVLTELDTEIRSLEDVIWSMESAAGNAWTREIVRQRMQGRLSGLQSARGILFRQRKLIDAQEAADRD